MRGTRTPRVLIVRNDPESGPGRLKRWLTELGADPVITPAAELPETLAGYAGLIMLGGGFMPDADADHPFLPRERALASEALATGLPTLGICLGGQLLAHLGGGTVTAKSGETERGMCALTVRPEADGDPVFGDFGAGSALRMIEHHQDSITVPPPDATLLVSSEVCAVQAFRLGDAAWGLQFHPEIPPDRVARWDADELRAEGIDRDELAAAAIAHDAANTSQSRSLIAAWARLL